MTFDDAIKALSSDALKFVKDDFVIGLGSGRAATSLVKSLAKLFKGFATLLKKNEVLLKITVGGFTALLGVLTSLFIIGTIGALLFILAATLDRVAKAQATVAITTNTMFASFLKYAVVAFGVFLALKGIDSILGVVKDGIEASELPTLALAAAMTALGAALTIIPFKLGGLKDAVKGGGLFAGLTAGAKQVPGILKTAAIAIGSFFAGIPASIKAVGLKDTLKLAAQGIGSTFSKGLTGAAAPLVNGVKGLIQTLGKAGLIGAAIAAAVAIGLAIKNHIDEKVANSRLFTDGFQSETEAFGFQFKASIASAISEAGKAISKLPEFFSKAFEGMWNTLLKFIDGAGTAIDKFFAGDVKGALIAAENAIDALFEGDLLEGAFSAIQGTFDARFLAEEEIVKTISTALREGKSESATSIVIAEILKTTKQQRAEDLGNFDMEGGITKDQADYLRAYLTNPKLLPHQRNAIYGQLKTEWINWYDTKKDNLVVTFNDIAKIPRHTTGSLVLDDLFGGGLPVGRIINLFGPESSGKSAIHPEKQPPWPTH